MTEEKKRTINIEKLQDGKYISWFDGGGPNTPWPNGVGDTVEASVGMLFLCAYEDQLELVGHGTVSVIVGNPKMAWGAPKYDLPPLFVG